MTNTTAQNTPAEPRLVALPYFSGFYCSNLADIIDAAEEQTADHEEEKQGSVEYYPDTYEPNEALRLSASDFADILSDCVDYRAAYGAIAKDWVSAFDDVLIHALDLPANSLRFHSLISPKYYNFETDRAFASITDETVEALFAISASEGHSSLAKVLQDSFTSYDGFSSFYSNDLAEWLDVPLEDWDCNEVGALLAAALLTKGIGHGAGAASWSGSLADELDQVVTEEGYQYVDNHTDWGKFEQLVSERREELKAATAQDLELTQ